MSPALSSEEVESTLAEAELQEFLMLLRENAAGFGESWSLPEILEIFGEPGQLDLFLNTDQQLHPEIVEYRLFPDQTPEQVLEEIVMPELVDRRGFELREHEEFANGKVYEVRKGWRFVQYIHIVPLNPGSGSVLVIWNQLPLFRGERS
jgi:hypothetical protein